MRVKINGMTSFALSVGLAGQPLVVRLIDQNCHQDICRQDALVEPPHTHQEPQIPGQTFVVRSPAVSGSNVASQTHSVDASIADANLVLPLGGLRAATDSGGVHTEYFGHLRNGIASVQQTANLCIVYTGAGTAYVLVVQLGVPALVRPLDTNTKG
jgi:hypothetical protein